MSSLAYTKSVGVYLHPNSQESRFDIRFSAPATRSYDPPTYIEETFKVDEIDLDSVHHALEELIHKEDDIDLVGITYRSAEYAISVLTCTIADPLRRESIVRQLGPVRDLIGNTRSRVLIYGPKYRNSHRFTAEDAYVIH